MTARMMENTKMNRPIGRILICLIFCLAASSVAIAKLVVTVDRTQLSDADVLKLVIKIENETVTGQPDLGVLSKDFEVLRVNGPNSERRMSITNGQRVNLSSTTWELLLRPRRLGTINIPGFAYGTEQSNPIVITVVPQTEEMKRRMDQYVLLETSVSSDEVYVQGQILYTVKLLYVENISGNFPAPPVFENAIVETLEDERRYDTVDNGRRFYVLEKRYAIFPQRSGGFTIPRQSFTGVRSGNGFFSNREQVGTSSSSHEINVKPKPEVFAGGDWLPAKSLQLFESWDSEQPSFTIGEPINRTLTLKVTGLAVTLIPPISGIEIEGAKTYQDPPLETQEITNSGISSTKVMTIGIVPTQPGTMVIPEIRLPWWNTDTNKMEVAIVPEGRYEVSGLVQNNVQQSQQTQLLQVNQEHIANAKESASSSPFWKMVAALMSVLWLGTLLLWWHKPRVAKKQDEPAQAPQTNQSALFKELLRKCRNNESEHILNSLFIWGKTKYPKIESTSHLLKIVNNSNFSEEIKHLERSLYSETTSTSWEGSNLVKLLVEVDNIQLQQTKSAALAASLNPV
ncbi:MAG: hypothetical protein ACJA2O_004156 [Candidatus Azotimanducaceae bacterium]|jgi:hypothetical protein